MLEIVWPIFCLNEYFSTHHNMLTRTCKHGKACIWKNVHANMIVLCLKYIYLIFIAFAISSCPCCEVIAKGYVLVSMIGYMGSCTVYLVMWLLRSNATPSLMICSSIQNIYINVLQTNGKIEDELPRTKHWYGLKH